LFTAVIGNLDGILQIGQGAWHRLVEGGRFPPFDFWRSSRVLPFQENFDPSPLAFWVPDKILNASDMSPHITEFPFFTFLFADLHAHMMAIPFTLLVIGLGLSLVVGLRDGGRIWPFAAAGALSLALGSLWAINSWDYPSYALLTVALLCLAVYFKPGPAVAKLCLLVALTAGVVALSLLAFLPFHQSYEAFNAGLDGSAWRTPIGRFLGIHGLFLFIIATFLVYQARSTLTMALQGVVPGVRGGLRAIVGSRERRVFLPAPNLALVLGLALGLAVALVLAVAGYWTALLLLVFMMLAGVVIRDVLRSGGGDRPFAAVPLVLLAMALAIAIGVDLVRVEGDIGRMNTLFKYYLEVWVLLSLASAYMLWRLVRQGLFRWRRRWVTGAWLTVLVVLLGSSLIYTVLGTRARLADRFNPGPSTLEGTAYMARAVHWEDGRPLDLKWDQETIRWLQDNVVGSPVVLEAHNEQYRWSARISVYTGLPTVLGWPWHQIQQRAPYEHAVRERADRVREMYNTTDLARAEALLRQYEVRYIVVGELERTYYSPAGLQKFEAMAEQGLVEPVFGNPGVVIYRTKR
jgi:YYY domain-containing protein